MTTSTVLPFDPTRVASKDKAIHTDATLELPVVVHSMNEIQDALESAHLGSDVRGLYLGFPEFKSAVERLAQVLSVCWPVHGAPAESAVIRAVICAVQRVRDGLAQDEQSKRAIIFNFLNTLCNETAAHVTKVHAWGFAAGKPVQQYVFGSESFVSWANGGQFDEVRFVFREHGSADEQQGLRMKILCDVAQADTVGIVTRFK